MMTADEVLTIKKLMAALHRLPTILSSPLPTVFSLDPRLPKNKGVVFNRKGDAVGSVSMDGNSKVEFYVLSKAVYTHAMLGLDLYEHVMSKIKEGDDAR